MKLQKQKVKNFIGFLVFFFLIWEVFIHCTYLFRDTYRAGRQNIIGFYDEKEDSLDVVVIGASCVYRYWDCMRVWKSRGITSYDYSVGSMSPAATISAIKDIQKTQNPQLIIFDVRKILSRFPDTIGGIWGTIDSQDYNTNRLAAVEYYCRLNGVALQDALPEIVDIITYHNNHAALASELSWQLWDNRIDESLDKEGFYKGFAINSEHVFVETPQYAQTEETMALDEQLETVYIDILEYCQANDVPLLLVASPFAVTKEDTAQFNRMEEIAQEYHIPFLNTNKYYEEMDLNFATDFYDVNHANIYGAEKYTDFLAEYITKNYELSNRSDESLNSAWENVYEKYDLEVKEAHKTLQQAIDDKYRAFEIEKAMRKANQAYHWLSMADNSNITVLVLMCRPCDNMPSLESRSYLEKYGVLFGEGDEYHSYMARFSDEVLYGSYVDTEHAGQLGEKDSIDYFLSTGGKPQLTIGGKNYFGDSLSGIHMAAFDNNTNEVVDVVNINISENGSLMLEHYETGGSL